MNDIVTDSDTLEEQKLTPPMQLAALALAEGIPPKTIAKAINYHTQTIYDNRKKLEKWSLTRPKIVKLAHQAIADTLQMVEVNGVKPRVSDRMAACNMVYDRAEPKHADQPVQQNNFIEINLSPFKNQVIVPISVEGTRD